MRAQTHQPLVGVAGQREVKDACRGPQGEEGKRAS